MLSFFISCALLFFTWSASAEIQYPYKIELNFNILTKGIMVGEGVEVFERSDNRYRIKSVTRPRGIAALFLAPITRFSEGEITVMGLKPSRYEEVGRKGGNRVAIFNWSTKTLRIIHTDQEIELPLSEGTIDQASFLFSFIGNVNVNQFEVSLTDGKRLKNYYYSLSDKTILNLPGGVYSTLLYSKEVENIQDRQFEIWITPELFNIPVRVQYTDRKGRRFDALITKIEINTNDPK